MRFTTRIFFSQVTLKNSYGEVHCEQVFIRFPFHIKSPWVREVGGGTQPPFSEEGVPRRVAGLEGGGARIIFKIFLSCQEEALRVCDKVSPSSTVSPPLRLLFGHVSPISLPT